MEKFLQRLRDLAPSPQTDNIFSVPLKAWACRHCVWKNIYSTSIHTPPGPDVQRSLSWGAVCALRGAHRNSCSQGPLCRNYGSSTDLKKDALVSRHSCALHCSQPSRTSGTQRPASLLRQHLWKPSCEQGSLPSTVTVGMRLLSFLGVD